MIIEKPFNIQGQPSLEPSCWNRLFSPAQQTLPILHSRDATAYTQPLSVPHTAHKAAQYTIVNRGEALTEASLPFSKMSSIQLFHPKVH
jgi:hypothetical protein